MRTRPPLFCLEFTALGVTGPGGFAESMTGRDGITAYALEADALAEALHK